MESINNNAEAIVDEEVSNNMPEVRIIKHRDVVMRAKKMIMGDIDIGQYRFKSTDTMLPKKHQNLMTPLLQLFGQDIIIIDVVANKRSALGFLAPKNTQSMWVPGSEYILQIACEAESTVYTKILSAAAVTCDTWVMGNTRVHNLNEFPKRQIARTARLAESPDILKTLWSSMVMVFIWEREEQNDLEALIKFVSDQVRQN